MSEPETTPTHRPIYGRALSFEDWLKERGIDPRLILSEHEAATAIGQIIFPTQRTHAQKGKQDALTRRLAQQQALRAEYEQAVPRVIVGHRPLDPNSSADQAYLRVQARRAEARRASQPETQERT